jgi:adenine-specific DNA-methyltransferase
MLKDANQSEKNLPISFVKTPKEIADLMVGLISKIDTGVVLDTGCGKGAFIKSLIEREFKSIEGIELDHDLYQYCVSEFPEASVHHADFLTWNPSKKYDIIIGNPPYAHFNSLPVNIQREVRLITGTSESDIYYAFIIKSIDRLKENGELIYIVPYGFFYNTHAKNVRKKIIENGYIDLIIDLDEVRLFEGENPETIIFRFRKAGINRPLNLKIIRVKQKNRTIKQIKTDAQKALAMKKGNRTFNFHQRDTFVKADEIWSTFPEIKIPRFVLMKDIALVCVGLVSGYDAAFKLDGEYEGKFNEEEKKSVRRFVKSINCKGFFTESFVEYFLVDDSMKSEEEFKNRFPNFFDRIAPYRKEMSDRYLPGNAKWFNWQALRNKGKMDRYMNLPRIFVPTLDRSLKGRFSISPNGEYPAGDVLAIIPLNMDIEFLTAYLNSNFFREYYLSHGARKGGRMAFTQRVLANIKIPLFDNETVSSIRKISHEMITNRDLSKRELIDNLIIKAFEHNSFKSAYTVKRHLEDFN